MRRGRSRYLKRQVLCLTLLLALPLVSLDAFAQASSRQEAVDMARQQGGDGQVLGVRETPAADGGTDYEVKMLVNGRVRVFRIRGQSR